jgi:hypothetical protein
LFADGVAVQWVAIQQWTEPTLLELIRRWATAFDGRIELWRGDLSPSSPYLAIVARGPSPSSRLEVAPATLPDRLIGSPLPALSLRLADTEAVRNLLSPGASRPRIENPWLMAEAARGHREAALGPEWLLQKFSIDSSRLGGPSEGGLVYTRAALEWLRGERDWEKDRSKAVKLMGFDPTDDLYRDLFPTIPGKKTLSR